MLVVEKSWFYWFLYFFIFLKCFFSVLFQPPSILTVVEIAWFCWLLYFFIFSECFFSVLFSTTVKMTVVEIPLFYWSFIFLSVITVLFSVLFKKNNLFKSIFLGSKLYFYTCTSSLDFIFFYKPLIFLGFFTLCITLPKSATSIPLHIVKKFLKNKKKPLKALYNNVRTFSKNSQVFPSTLCIV